MSPGISEGFFGASSLWVLIRSGGFAMFPLVLFSIVSWILIFERAWNFWRLGRNLNLFHLQAVAHILKGDRNALRQHAEQHKVLPSAQLVLEALSRQGAADIRIRQKWLDGVERRRQLLNQQMRRSLWILGTIGSSSPFIGLFGTVVGILRSFQEMARTGSGGFTVVAGGISESLIATAVGIVVAVVAVLAFNTFQTRWASLVLTVRLQNEELMEMLGHGTENSDSRA